MLTPLTINHPAENLFFVSDLHWGHEKMAIPRGFTSGLDHDNSLIHTWNERCDEESVVFHLGDLVFKDPDGARFESLTRKLAFKTLYLLLGNHVSGHKQVYKKLLAERLVDTDAPENTEVYPLVKAFRDGYEGKVVFLPQYIEILVNKEPLVLSHYPIESWNGMAANSIHLHGHSHGNLIRKSARRRDVGIECYGGPVSLRQLLTEMKDEKPEIVDHHGEKLTTNTAQS